MKQQPPTVAEAWAEFRDKGDAIHRADAFKAGQIVRCCIVPLLPAVRDSGLSVPYEGIGYDFDFRMNRDLKDDRWYIEGKHDGNWECIAGPTFAPETLLVPK